MNPSHQHQVPIGSDPSAPYNSGVFTGPPGYGQTPAPKKSIWKSKLLLVVGGIVIVALIMAVVLALVLGGKKEAPKIQQNSSSNSDSSGDAQPATAASVGQIDNSISQDISTLNDDTDFPVKLFDDKELGL